MSTNLDRAMLEILQTVATPEEINDLSSLLEKLCSTEW